MKLCIVLVLTLMAVGSIAEKSKGRKSFILPSDSRVRQVQNQYNNEDHYDDVGNMELEGKAVALKPDSSKGRLFFRKFFLMGGNQTPQPQIIVISRPPGVTTATATDTGSGISGTGTSNEVINTGTITLAPAGRGEDDSDDYFIGEDDVDEDEIINERGSSKKDHNSFKLVKGKRNQQAMNIVVPSKYMRYLQGNRNVISVNPSATYNTGTNKMKKFRPGNNAGSIKKKRSRRPVRQFGSKN